MGMPLELNTMIVTKGRETRLDENFFSLVKDGYRLYPLDIPVEVKRTIDGDLNGMGVIRKVEWENSQTLITYQLVSLNSTN
ncbi:DUF2584 domain-containing protein [Cytobacillus oceanisediminis]|uniref:DUF2584 domain-containing protein n=1 Tax=Cytobacillus TaxID=2675230 RepID=UPI001C8DB375|nr:MULTISPECIES: DUF2584 domain-containing protein [Cytobacillus]MBX9973426.1 DUF2584 domain-containing protein [Cytobacillus firmus]MDF2038996.1 DUF2584 domain-containing protein [Cytobacillus oceanisediminis]